VSGSGNGRTTDKVARYRALADEGDLTAQIRLAWEYAWGDKLLRDFKAAESLFRQAERKEPGLARYYITKLKLQTNDPTFVDEVPDHYVPGFGPAFYLVGKAKLYGWLGVPNLDEAKKYLQLAVEDHHLLAELVLWRISRKSIWRWLITMPHVIGLVVRHLSLAMKNENDPRVLL
jgi:TPR repeat protein